MPSAQPAAVAARSTWRFPAAFWIANSIELFERAAYYGTFIALSLFLTNVAHFSDVQAGWIGAGFSSLIYLLPLFTGAASDRIGFRVSLALAFALLAAGYASLGLYSAKPAVLASLALIAVGGAFVKPVITGTVARVSSPETRARAYSLFYMMVNIGSFSGKTIAKPVRVILGLSWVPLYSAGAALIALVLVLLLFRPAPAATGSDPARSAREVLRGLVAAFRQLRFLALILITAGYWVVQGQLYASMPKYVLRTVGEGASPEWYANVNPLVVVALVVPITQLVRRWQPVSAIAVALALVPVAALTMTLSPLLRGPLTLFGVSFGPVTVVMVLGIAIQAVAECFLSPRYLEYASRQAPPGREGLYLGYAHLNTFFAWLVGFILSGYLLDAFCPDPAKLDPSSHAAWRAALAGHGSMPPAYAHAHYIWYFFAALGLASFLLLLLFRFLTRPKEATARIG